MPAMPRPKASLKILKKVMKKNPNEIKPEMQNNKKMRGENPYMREMRMTIKR